MTPDSTRSAKKKRSVEPRILHGSGASPGLVVGKVLVLRRRTRRAGWHNLPKKKIDP